MTVCSQSIQPINKLKMLDIDDITALVESSNSKNSYCKEQSLIKLITRYPFLYKHIVVDYNNEVNLTKIVQDLTGKYHIQLSHYLIYLSRINDEKVNKQNIRIVKNPTLLDEKSLRKSIKHFSGKVYEDYTHKDLASFFAMRMKNTNYGNFKNLLINYLILGIEQPYQNILNQKLARHLKSILPVDTDNQLVNNQLISVTLKSLLDYLIISEKSHEHIVFLDLITNLRTTYTMGLFWKILLLAEYFDLKNNTVKDYFDRKTAMIFMYYQSYRQEEVQWLIRFLEQTLVSYAVSSIDTSLFNF